MFNDLIRQAVRRALDCSVPFVVFVRPDENKVHFYADVPGISVDKRCFVKINSWCGGTSTEDVIHCNCDAGRFVELADFHEFSRRPESAPWSDSTAYEDYIINVDRLVERLMDYGGKTVYSRTICGNNDDIDWIVVADAYFEIHPEAFRYMYYTSRYGCWLGASPELLVKVVEGRFETMALAGTRSADKCQTAWDGKNVAEQAIVRNYIADRLYDLGLKPEVGATETIKTGNLCHLRTIIRGNCENCRFSEILRALNPTPALAGYPLPAALENIAGLEAHPRRCYGSYIAVEEESKSEAYVNLRCVNFDSEKWCMYVGGGIMPDSDSESEWLETEAKSKLLLELILNESRKD